MYAAGNLIHAKAQDEGSGPPAQTTGPEGNVKVNRLMAAIEYGRPLSQHWNGTLGVNFQRANCLDDHNQPMTKVVTTAHSLDGRFCCRVGVFVCSRSCDMFVSYSSRVIIDALLAAESGIRG